MRSLRVLGPLACVVLLSAACAPAGGSGNADTLSAAAPAAAAVPGAAGAPPTGNVESGSVIVPLCVPAYDAPPYQIGAVGSFSGGGLTVIDGVTVSNLSGVFCAVATVQDPPADHPDATVCAAVTAPATGLQFNPVSTDITLLPGVKTVIGDVTIAPQEFTAFVCNDGLPGPIALTTTIRASAAPHLFGTACDVGPLEAKVTGSLTGPLTNLAGTVTSPPVAVAAVQPGPSCPAGLARNANDILGLPLPATKTGLSLQVKVALYLPPQP